MIQLNDLASKIKNNYLINRAEANMLLNYSYFELKEYANEIRLHFCGNAFDMCTIVNGKNGKCSEDCKYCAQSAHYNTNIKIYKLLNKKTIIQDALSNFNQGVSRYSVVTSGKKLSENELNSLCETFNYLNSKTEIKLCASLGLLDYKDFVKLKQAGVVRYHNNLETSRKYFTSICTSHTYDQKIKTIKEAQRAGLEVCSGGIIGMGESFSDRIDLAFELRKLGIMSIPINLLNPIEGTPLANINPIDEEQFLKTAAIFRFINPTATIRLAGGRNLLTRHGQLAFKYGVNGTISGNLLTTYGNSTFKDIALIKELGYEVK
ncbi:biotin synthase BioB [Clostridium sp. 'deep sea']|uniref:biotin synthase BioB n=1 Tax=Clostridium sp. 'deep sea' TaxID=2779445 RepID=UPI00189684FD|nr:biotin synthase BioB [Clostridium sp. 'deep sea']QOR35460.1 biotin synthase BioB [Clostridium sp. 'deep sea']